MLVIVTSSLSGLTEWENLYLENLILQQSYRRQLGGKYPKHYAVLMGITLANLSKFGASSYFFAIEGLEDSGINRTLSLLEFSKTSIKCGEFKLAMDCMESFTSKEIEIETFTKDDYIKVDQYFTKAKKQLKSNIDKTKYKAVAFNERPFSSSFASFFFENYEFFEKKCTIIEFYLKAAQAENSAMHKYAVKVISDLNMFKSTGSVVAATIATKGNTDLMKSFNLIFEFIAAFPLNLLTLSLLNFYSIDYIINETVEKSENLLFSNDVTMEEILTLFDNSHKNPNFLDSFLNYIKGKIIVTVKTFLASDIDKSFILFDFEAITRWCMNGLQLLDPFFKTEMLGKKFLEKRKRFIHAYQNNLKDFSDQLIRCLLVSLIYSLLYHRDFPSLTAYSCDKIIRGLRQNTFKRLVSELKTGFILSESKKVSWKNPKVLKNANTFCNEVLCHLDAEEVLPEVELMENNNKKYRKVNTFYTERLIANYISTLEANSLDDPKNVKIIKYIMYYVVLQGGYHISLIWFLNVLEKIAMYKSQLSIISYEEGEDTIDFMLFSEVIKPYRHILDHVIKKLCSAQSKYDNMEATPNASTLLNFEENSALIMSQVLIDSDGSIVFLPEFCNFIQVGDTVRMNLNNAQSTATYKAHTLANKTKEMAKRKSILRPSKEIIYECLKKSSVLIEAILNSGKIPLVEDAKQCEHLRHKIELSCRSIMMPFADNKDSISIDKTKGSENVIDRREVEQIVKQFRSENPVTEKNADIREQQWRMFVESGTVGCHTRLGKL